jgi:hypothetical protein
LVGTQTTRSGIAVTASGSVIVPRSVLTLTRAPSATPTSAAVPADSRATACFAVAAR